MHHLPFLRSFQSAAALAVCALGCSLAGTPNVHVNQLGYLPQSLKLGVAQSSATAPLDWQVVDAAGSVVASGKTQLEGHDEDSGDDVHLADFSELTRPG